jgi:hypothetical protein
MLRKVVGTAVALLLAVGVSLAADKKGGTKPKRGPGAVGKITAVDLKGGVGTVTVLAKKSKDAEAEKMTFKVTKDTKFAVGAGKGKKPTPVEADNVGDTFKKGTTVYVRYEKKDEDLIAKMVVKFTLRKKKDDTR